MGAHCYDWSSMESNDSSALLVIMILPIQSKALWEKLAGWWRLISCGNDANVCRVWALPDNKYRQRQVRSPGHQWKSVSANWVLTLHADAVSSVCVSHSDRGTWTKLPSWYPGCIWSRQSVLVAAFELKPSELLGLMMGKNQPLGCNSRRDFLIVPMAMMTAPATCQIHPNITVVTVSLLAEFLVLPREQVLWKHINRGHRWNSFSYISLYLQTFELHFN